MTAVTEQSASGHGQPHGLPLRTLVALGVVFGDIGTSPIYTLKECFRHAGGMKPDDVHVLGILSLIFWSLIVVVTIKYVVVIMRADNRGEGGVMALTALAIRKLPATGRARGLVAIIGLTGTALFYGDAAITPAISVLSAIEGLEILTPAFTPYVLPLTLVILTGLFAFQRHGTARVGLLFGPIILVWFLVLAVLGIIGIAGAPRVLGALLPHHGVALLVHEPGAAMLVLGAVVLAFTGAEALYADMGHFGAKPIRLAWSALVLPGLTLNYFGQGALLLQDPAALRHPFYLLAPDWLLAPMVALTTAATVIAAQATISGAFSLTRQAMQLGYLPRLRILHTSETDTGQIYIPRVNWGMWLAVVWLCITFRNSGALASAYGIAVTGTMLMTTLLAFVVVRQVWGFGWLPCFALVGSMFAVDLLFFSANLLKIADGGWFPLLLGAGVLSVMLTWKRGRELVAIQLDEGGFSEEQFLNRVTDNHPPRVPGTAVFLTAASAGIPNALLHNLKHNKVLHARVILLTILNEEVPRVRPSERASVTHIQKGFWRVVLRYGFMETPDVPPALNDLRRFGLALDPMETSFFLGRDNVVAGPKPGLPAWRRKIFVWLSRNGESAPNFFRLPPNRVVELGTQIEI